MSATSTFTSAFVPASGRSGSPRPSRLKRIFTAIIAGQERRARAIVHTHLAFQDDAALARLGWTAADVAALRRARPVATRI